MFFNMHVDGSLVAWALGFCEERFGLTLLATKLALVMLGSLHQMDHVVAGGWDPVGKSETSGRCLRSRVGFFEKHYSPHRVCREWHGVAHSVWQ